MFSPIRLVFSKYAHGFRDDDTRHTHSTGHRRRQRYARHVTRYVRPSSSLRSAPVICPVSHERKYLLADFQKGITRPPSSSLLLFTALLLFTKTATQPSERFKTNNGPETAYSINTSIILYCVRAYQIDYNTVNNAH